MEPEDAPTKVQVVYYLSRCGQLQQPHLIDVTVSPRSNGLYLRDVKSKLTTIRGQGVADSFSWSCKRNYKDNYIWQDLSDDDKILPLGDGEFVLKGSGLYSGGCRSPGRSDFTDSMNLSPTKRESAAAARTNCKSEKVKTTFNFEEVKKTVDFPPQRNVQDQNELAAALTLSLQLMRNPHANLRRFSRDKSMDLNQQVMTSLSQAKVGPAEERTLDHYDMSSNETFLSEESTTRNFRENPPANEDRSRSASSTCTQTMNPGMNQTEGMTQNDEVPLGRNVNAQHHHQHGSSRTDVGHRSMSSDSRRSRAATDGGVGGSVRGRQQAAAEDILPSIKTKTKGSCGTTESSENLGFMLSPRRIMAVLSTPERRLGKVLHSPSLRSSNLSNSTSTNSVEPMSALKFSKQATCLSQLRFCSQLSNRATDSRPDSPVRQNSMSMLVHPSETAPQSPASQSHNSSSPYWARWKASRKARAAEARVAMEEPAKKSAQAHAHVQAHVQAQAQDQAQAQTQAPAQGQAQSQAQSQPQFTSEGNDHRPAVNRQVLRRSFEFDMPADASSSGPGTPNLHTRNPSMETSTPCTPSRTLNKSGSNLERSNSYRASAYSSVNPLSHSETASTPISVKEVIAENSQGHPLDQIPQVPSPDSNSPNFSCVSSASSKEAFAGSPANSLADGSRDSSSVDVSSLPRVSISDSISAARTMAAGATAGGKRPNSPESPLKSNPPCSPARDISPSRCSSSTGTSPAAARVIQSPRSLSSRRAEDGKARARGLVKEVTSSSSSRDHHYRFLRDLPREQHLETSRSGSGPVRHITAAPKRGASVKSGVTITTVAAKPIASSFTKSPPRISSMLWEDPPLSQR